MVVICDPFRQITTMNPWLENFQRTFCGSVKRRLFINLPLSNLIFLRYAKLVFNWLSDSREKNWSSKSLQQVQKSDCYRPQLRERWYYLFAKFKLAWVRCQRHSGDWPRNGSNSLQRYNRVVTRGTGHWWSQWYSFVPAYDRDGLVRLPKTLLHLDG